MHMEGISEHRNRFLIDLHNERVFCRSCREICKKLVLPGFTQFWCANHDCDNTGEVTLTRDGTWNVYCVVEEWLGDLCGGFSSKLLFSQETGHKDPETPC